MLKNLFTSSPAGLFMMLTARKVKNLLADLEEKLSQSRNLLLSRAMTDLGVSLLSTSPRYIISSSSSMTLEEREGNSLLLMKPPGPGCGF